MAAPSCLSTVYTTIARFKKAVNELGQDYVPICFDMGLLTKAFDIVWADPSQLHIVTLMEGGMPCLSQSFQESDTFTEILD